jgi:hypothetical protein
MKWMKCHGAVLSKWWHKPRHSFTSLSIVNKLISLLHNTCCPLQTMAEVFRNVILNIVLHRPCKRSSGQSLRLLLHFTLYCPTVRIVTIVQAGRFKVQFLAESRYFYPLQNTQTGSGAHPTSYSMDNGSPPPPVEEQLRLKLSTHLHPLMRLEISYTSSTTVCFYAMDRDKFSSL